MGVMERSPVSPMTKVLSRLLNFDDSAGPSKSRSPQAAEQLLLSAGSPESRISSSLSESFEAAEDLEKGDCGPASDLLRVRNPPAVIEKLHRHTVVYSEQNRQYQLMTESLDLVLIAKRAQGSDLRIDFLLPGCEGRAAFHMSRSKDADQWLLVQPRCECCAHRPHHLTCEFMGRGQQVACILHSRRKVQQASVHYVDMHVPPLISEDTSALWCPAWTGKDLGGKPSIGASPTASLTPKNGRSFFPQLMPEEGSDSIHLWTKLPIWNSEFEALILKFEERSMLQSSPRNFMVCGPEGPEARPVFQHAQIAPNTWCLDFKNPLSSIQAFALAMSSVDWD
eukprot:TRINITY_DN32711_c0_g1_i1.p1 TRINITY_DN32711_c0_g1~~TRINITY_DN32711_c0_g1_i1.p1  ORF type:complete len:338 (-),score=55.31 TRINITY_DN32711_c0_g1_i1:12-1025(-)